MSMNKDTRNRFLVPALVFCISLAGTFGVYLLVNHSVASARTSQFQDQTAQITSLIESRMNLYTNIVYGAQGLFAASQSVEKNEWIAYVNELELPQNYAGVSGMTYIERVPKSAIATYPYHIFPVSDKSDYYPITYTASSTTVSATAATSTAVGYDSSSDPVRWKALYTAADTDTPTASGVVLTVTSHLPSFAVYAPIYANGSPHTTRAARWAVLKGFVSVSFRVKDLFQGLTSDPLFNKNIDLQVYDAPSLAQANSSNLLFATNGATSTATRDLSETTHVTVGGRVWTLQFSALPTYTLQAVERYAPLGVLGIGVLLSFLLAWLIYAYSASREKALALAKKLSADFEDSQKLFHLSMDNAGDMLLLIDETGKFIDVNPRACQVLGYTKEEMLTMSVPDIDMQWSTEKLSATLKELKPGVPLIAEGTQKKKDGTIFPVEVSTTLFEYQGKRMIMTLARDISTRKESEAKLKERSDELERLNALMVGRELKMVELKQEITKLKE